MNNTTGSTNSAALLADALLYPLVGIITGIFLSEVLVLVLVTRFFQHMDVLAQFDTLAQLGLVIIVLSIIIVVLRIITREYETSILSALFGVIGIALINLNHIFD